MACDVSLKSRFSKLNNENVLLKTQVDYVVQERENIKLEYQKLFNSIKTTRAQQQQEVNKLVENISQKTFTYGDVHSKNQDLLMIISELKEKLKTFQKRWSVNTKFEKFVTSRKLLCVTTLPTNTVVQAKKVSKSEDNTDSACSKHMTGNLQQLRNFIVKFIGTIRFGNDHFEAITGYGDDVQGNLTICHVYYVEGLGHTLFSYNKTPYKLIRGRKPNVQYFYVFGSLCYPINGRDDLGKMKPKADIGIFIGYSESSRGFRIYNRQTKKIMGTILVKFDKLIAMASECNSLGPGLNCLNFQDSSEELNEITS
nr:retrovirus-related Pol polyprotein from transposon TNT 1-94 [Tanacetum cinerariifolium]